MNPGGLYISLMKKPSNNIPSVVVAYHWLILEHISMRYIREAWEYVGYEAQGHVGHVM